MLTMTDRQLAILAFILDELKTETFQIASKSLFCIWSEIPIWSKTVTHK